MVLTIDSLQITNLKQLPASLPPGILLLVACLDHTLRSLDLEANKTSNEFLYKESDSSFVFLSDSHLYAGGMERFKIWAGGFCPCRFGSAHCPLLHVCSLEKPPRHLWC